MEELVSEIKDALAVKTAFTIPLFGGIDVTETVVITWVIIALMTCLAFILTRNLKITNCSEVLHLIGRYWQNEH